MPWLSRQSSAEHESPTMTEKLYAEKLKMEKHSAVSFVPAQIDTLCGTSPANRKRPSTQLIMGDLRVLVQSLATLPDMIASFYDRKFVELCLCTPQDIRDLALQFGLAIIEIWMVVAITPMFLLLPGFVFAQCAGICWGIIALMQWPLNGAPVVMNRRDSVPITEDFSDERWIYVNGTMCSNRSLKAQCDRLSTTFSRHVMGVHNRTYGGPIDLLVSLFQRTFSFSTPCTRHLTSHLRDTCLNNSVRKVILLSDGTGAIHVSIALDRLHADLPVEVLSKLEIYTFGAAASHLSNPLLRLEDFAKSPGIAAAHAKFMRPDGSMASPVKAALATLGHRVEDHERVIPHVEHYALRSDLFARWGVLHNVCNVLDNRFCGRVFAIDDSKLTRRSRGSGFMMCNVYLDLLFPQEIGPEGTELLDQVVDVDAETAEKREFTAQGMLPMKPFEEGLRSPSVSPRSRKEILAERKLSWGSGLAVDVVRKARDGARESQGRTVRQLSRLWRFAGGGRPVGEGVAVANGVGVEAHNQET